MDYLSLGAWAPALYSVIAFAVALDAAVPPIPAEVMVVTSGALSVTGHVVMPLAWLAATGGSVLGDLLIYALFKRRLTHLLDRFRWGRQVHVGIRKAAARGGRSSTAAALLAGRFLPAGRTATMAAAGIAEVPANRVLRASVLGSALWASWLMGLGYATGRSTNLPLWASALVGAGLGLAVGLLMAIVLGLRRRIAARRHPRPDAGGEP